MHLSQREKVLICSFFTSLFLYFSRNGDSVSKGILHNSLSFTIYGKEAKEAKKESNREKKQLEKGGNPYVEF